MDPQRTEEDKLITRDDPLPVPLLTGFGSGRRYAASRRLRRHEPLPKPLSAHVSKAVQ